MSLRYVSCIPCIEIESKIINYLIIIVLVDDISSLDISPAILDCNRLQWLHWHTSVSPVSGYTYLYIRMLRNPSLYGITHDETEKDPLLEQVWNGLIQWIDANKLAFDQRTCNFIQNRVSSFEIIILLLPGGCGIRPCICFILSSGKSVNWGLLVLNQLRG